jgi:hypothetical protein
MVFAPLKKYNIIITIMLTNVIWSLVEDIKNINLLLKKQFLTFIKVEFSFTKRIYIIILVSSNCVLNLKTKLYVRIIIFKELAAQFLIKH